MLAINVKVPWLRKFWSSAKVEILRIRDLKFKSSFPLLLLKSHSFLTKQKIIKKKIALIESMTDCTWSLVNLNEPPSSSYLWNPPLFLLNKKLLWKIALIESMTKRTWSFVYLNERQLHDFKEISKNNKRSNEKHNKFQGQVVLLVILSKTKEIWKKCRY